MKIHPAWIQRAATLLLSWSFRQNTLFKGGGSLSFSSPPLWQEGRYVPASQQQAPSDVSWFLYGCRSKIQWRQFTRLLCDSLNCQASIVKELAANAAQFQLFIPARWESRLYWSVHPWPCLFSWLSAAVKTTGLMLLHSPHGNFRVEAWKASSGAWRVDRR